MKTLHLSKKFIPVLLLVVLIQLAFDVKAQTNSVTINYFSCNISNKVALITWQAKNEENIQYYEIEKSSNGENFTTIASIAAVGKAATLNNYVQRDELMLFIGTTIYYRIKAVNNLGNVVYIQKIIVAVNQTNTAEIKAWPNPCINQINIALNCTENTKSVIKIVDFAGKIYSTINCAVKKGQNNIVLSQVQSLPKGNYTVLIYIGTTQVESIKIAKL
jgi:hypothetical protein